METFFFDCLAALPRRIAFMATVCVRWNSEMLIEIVLIEYLKHGTAVQT